MAAVAFENCPPLFSDRGSMRGRPRLPNQGHEEQVESQAGQRPQLPQPLKVYRCLGTCSVTPKTGQNPTRNPTDFLGVESFQTILGLPNHPRPSRCSRLANEPRGLELELVYSQAQTGHSPTHSLVPQKYLKYGYWKLDMDTTKPPGSIVCRCRRPFCVWKGRVGSNPSPSAYWLRCTQLLCLRCTWPQTPELGRKIEKHIKASWLCIQLLSLLKSVAEGGSKIYITTQI